MKLNEIIELDNHRLMCGNAQSKENVELLLDGVKPNLLLTDPPYGINIVKVGGGKSVDKEGQVLDLSDTHPHTLNGTIRGAKPPSFNKRNSGHSSKTRLPQRERVIGKVGKPRHCRTKNV